MRDTKLITIKRDEYGYSIYCGSATRLETGNLRLADIRRRRVEIIALARVLTRLAKSGETIDHATAQCAKLAAAVRTMGRYHGRRLHTLDAIVDSVIRLHADKLA